MSFTALFAGGGSGGHVFPMLAVADALRAIRSDAHVVFAGTARGMEATVIPARGEILELLDAHPIKGGGISGAVRGMTTAATSLPAAREIVRRIDPDVVLSVGGYAAGSVALAARTLGVPVALMEPNSVLGLANVLMTPLVKRAYVAFPEVEKRFRPSVARRFGLPLRPGFTPIPYVAELGRAEILILGGSQGAKALNDTMPDAIRLAIARVPELRVLHQAGKGKDAEVRERYRVLSLADRVRVVPFVDDVPRALANADVIVGRAGAGSLAEVCAVGRAAIFVPFPFAADDHQRRNSESLAAAGAAVSVVQSEASAIRLAEELVALIRSPKRRVAMADAARKRGVPDAATRIVEDLITIAHRRAGESEVA